MLDDFKGYGSSHDFAGKSFRDALSLDRFDADFPVDASASPTTAETKPLFALGLGTWERNVTRSHYWEEAEKKLRDTV